MTTQEVKIQYNFQQWTALIQECQSSGLSIRDWCNNNDITESSYYYWLRRVRTKTLEALPTVTTNDGLNMNSTEKTIFTKVSISQNPTYTADVTIQINGLTIMFQNSATTELIRNILDSVNAYVR